MMASQHGLEIRVGNDDFHLDLGHEVDFVLRPPVHLGMALLAAEAADFGDGHARHAAFGQGLLDVVELEMADDGFNFFHVRTPRSDKDVTFFAMLAEVETFDLGRARDAEPHHGVEHLEDDEGADGGQLQVTITATIWRLDHPIPLIRPSLSAVGPPVTRRPRGEHAGENRAQGAATPCTPKASKESS